MIWMKAYVDENVDVDGDVMTDECDDHASNDLWIRKC